MKNIKLTDKDGFTRNSTKWEVGVVHRKKYAKNKGLCSDRWLHYYEGNIELALMLNPVHAKFVNPKAFEVKVGKRVLRDKQLKAGTTYMKVLKELAVPKITMETRIRFAIYCALTVYKEKTFVTWAKNWLSGKDRGYEAAANVVAAARSATVAYAANAAARSATATRAACAAAIYAANAAVYVADAAVYAAYTYAKHINLAKLAKRAVEIENFYFSKKA